MNRRHPWIATVVAFVVVACFTSSPLFARYGVIKTRDGRTIEGEIEEAPDKVAITIRNIRTVINRDNIEGQVEYFDNVEARYKDKLSKLPAKPAAADHLALARWLYDVKNYDLALAEIDKAKRIEPNSADAATLEQTVLSQRRIEVAKAANANGGGNNPPATTVRPPAGAGAGTGAKPPAAGGGDKPHYLSADDINIIRQMEWRETDTTVPRVQVPVDVRRKYVDLKALKPAEFASLTGPQQAYYVLQDGTPEMRKDVKVLSDPQSLTEYRRVVQPLVLNNCATAGCHGGNNAGRFHLYTNNAERDDVAYTNFYILQKYKQQVGDREYSMIDRTYPERSMLAQFALNPDAAELDHPELKGQTYKAMAANRQAPAYKSLVGWMKNLQAGEPNYGIDYTLPGGKPAERPKEGGPVAPPAGGAPANPAAQPGGIDATKTPSSVSPVPTPPPTAAPSVGPNPR